MARTLSSALTSVAGLALSAAGALAQGSLSLDAERAYAGELAADAGARTSLLGAAPRAGYDKGFVLADTGGDYKLNIGGYTQFRYVANVRDEPPGDDQEEFTSGFQATRTRLIFSGTVLNPDLSFFIHGGFTRFNGTFGLLDAFAKYDLDDGFSIKWGQYRLPLMREESVADHLQLFAERSVFNSYFSQDRSQGVELAYEGDSWRLMGDFSDGLASLNTDIDSDREADLAWTGRAEWKWDGEWSQFRDFTSWRGSELAGMVGGAIHWQSGGDTTGTFDADVYQYTLDASFEGDGWNAFAAFAGRHVETGDAPSVEDYGLLVQGGYFVSSQTELIARYDILLPDEVGNTPGTEKFQSFSVGANYYLSPDSHAAKFTADLQWYPDSLQGSEMVVNPNTNIGILDDVEGDQIVLRLQFQLVF